MATHTMLWSVYTTFCLYSSTAAGHLSGSIQHFANKFDNTDLRKAATFLVPKIFLFHTPGYQDLGVFPKWVALKANQSPKGDINLNYPNHSSP